MEIFGASKIFTWLVDKIIEKSKLWKTKKEDEENKEIIRSRLRSIFTDHENDIEKLFIDLLDEIKQQLSGKDDPKSNWLIWKIEDVKKWDLLDNIDKETEKAENNQVLVFMWKTFFYDDQIRNIQEDLKMNTDKILNLYSREASIYFSSNWTADTKLLVKEKKEILKMLDSSIYEFEKIILEKLQWLVQLSIVNSIKPSSTIDDDKISNMIKNTEKFANDIKEWKMKKYYNRMLNLFDVMIDEMIEKINK